MQKLAAWALFTCILFGLVWMNSRLPKDVRVVALHRSSSSGQQEIEIVDSGSQKTDGQRMGVAVHEMFHSLRSLDLFDFDVPMASAMGYYIEWKNDGKLGDAARYKDFLSGEAASLLDKSVSDRLSRYRIRFAKEDTKSYSAGAFLAGSVAREFKGDEQRAGRFLSALAMRFGPSAALTVANDGNTFELLQKLRRGGYSRIDEGSLITDMGQVTPSSRKLVTDYVLLLQHEYMTVFKLGHSDQTAEIVVSGPKSSQDHSQ